MYSIDDWTNKVMYETSQRKWIMQNWNFVQKYLDENVKREDHTQRWKTIRKYPLLGKALGENTITYNYEKIDFVLRTLTDHSVIGLVIGNRGMGKTAFMFWALEQAYIEYGKEVALINFPPVPSIPDYFHFCYDTNQIPSDCVAGYDETAVHASARRAMTKKSVDLTSAMVISRHKGFSMLALSQHSQLQDVNLLRLANLFVFKKPTWDDMQRKHNTTLDLLVEFVQAMTPRDKTQALVTDLEEWYLLKTPLPTFWDDDISRSYSEVDRIKAVELAHNWYKRGCVDLAKIQECLVWKGIEVDMLELENWIDNPRVVIANMRDSLKL
jgi:hypothetical protein